MKMIATLDKRYVYIWNPAETQHRRLLPQTSIDGLVTSGTFKGRRIINVDQSKTGSMFERYTSPDNPGYYDLISIKKPAASETGGWLEAISHETAHAFHAVNRPSSSSENATDRIRDAVAEEITTRRIEGAVLSEILKTASGRRILVNFAPSTGSLIRGVVERDFFPSPLRRTYLELFVLNELMRQAIQREKLTDRDQLRAKNEEVSRIPLRGWRSRKFMSEYSKIRFWMRVIDFRWQRAMQLRQPGTA